MRLLFLAIASIKVLCPYSASALTIDDFTAFQSVAITMLGQNAASRVASSSILGGKRGLALQDASGGVPVSANVGSGVLGYSQLGSGQALIQLIWNGDPRGGELGGVDFTEAGVHDSLRLVVASQTLGGLLQVTACTEPSISGNSACSRAIFTMASEILGAGVHLLPYSSFTPILGSAGVEFTRVHRISLRFQATGEGSLVVSSFSTIPEPSTVTLLGLGLAGVSVWRRRGCAAANR